MVPLECYERLSARLGIDFRVFRDDLYPMTGGGNKARKASRIFKNIVESGHNAVVTNGGLQSNHARVVALMAAAKGWPCKLVLHGDPSKRLRPEGNLLLMELSGADIVVVTPEQIGRQLEEAVLELERRGYRPELVPGGGHSLQGALAYTEAAEDFLCRCNALGWTPDAIIVASGTGTTQAGLLAGLKQAGSPARVIGISVARSNPRGKDLVLQAYTEVGQFLGLKISAKDVDFRDGWTCGGYEQSNPKLHTAISLAARLEGLILDPTYTGKAFLALMELIDQGEIDSGSKVVFWHTGGLLNLMSSGDLLGMRP